MTGSPGGDFLLMLGITVTILWALGMMMPPPPTITNWPETESETEDAEDEETPTEPAENHQAPRQDPALPAGDPPGVEARSDFPYPL